MVERQRFMLGSERAVKAAAISKPHRASTHTDLATRSNRDPGKPPRAEVVGWHRGSEVSPSASRSARSAGRTLAQVASMNGEFGVGSQLSGRIVGPGSTQLR